ncbi:glycine cleavage system protein GcvH [Silvimonas iriomotensis]|uniref:Glycine cleavage system H protein n=1 Tax=Silvimonas iriomotensis TaxID=449662 RepID=A0ABQ2PCU1_9NEIS|nr:glycine cleavage system protein GcvH [Silvimonas iriomotensis]GGP23065.1 glycine cleavage system H protein [Silvimonas iriomotensis]
MLDIPAELKYAASHEWMRLEADGTVTVGITHHAQELLGDLVFVELPKVGATLAKDEQAGVVESVKAASDVYAPIAGEIVAINTELESAPEIANTEPYADGWFFRLKPANVADLDSMLSAEDYARELGA